VESAEIRGNSRDSVSRQRVRFHPREPAGYRVKDVVARCWTNVLIKARGALACLANRAHDQAQMTREELVCKRF
jgi:hypothetical protein